MEMKDPFSGKTINGMNLLTMVNWVNDSSKIIEGGIASADWPIIALPPIQRSAIWRPKQVVDLWDSLFRGLPIGAFYLVQGPIGKRKIVALQDKTMEIGLPGYDLLDGQQRIRALLLGIVGFSEEKRCLWVDLGDNAAARGFGLHITSKGQPFGYDPKTGTKRSFEQRRAAREKLEQAGKLICKGREAYDHELFDGEVMQGGNRLCPQPPLPYRHSESIFFKLPDLFSEWDKDPSDCNDEKRSAALRAKVGSGPTAEALNNLHKAFKRIKQAEVALIRVNVGDNDDLLELFERIGAGGTPLSVEERLYSIYKHCSPYIRDAVNEIHGRVGKVLSPAKIASTAIRIAYVQSAEPKDDRINTPDVSTFSKILVHESKFQDWLNKLIPPRNLGGDEKGILLRSFESIKNLLWYENSAGEFWIPEVLLASLPAELWQVFIFWGVRHPEQTSVMRSRPEAVRFALFWHLCVWNHEKAARLAFDHIKRNEGIADFPGATLYQLLTGDGDEICAHGLIPPEEFERRLCKDESLTIWKTDAERFMKNDIRNEIGSHWWWHGEKMLPWLQREYIHQQFQDYVPLTDQEDDVPYDVDHICPKKDWRDDWRSMEKRLDVGNQLKEKIYKCRDLVGNGIGNLQILSSSENRKQKAGDLALKLPFSLDDSVLLTDVERKAMADFAFNPKDRGLWKRVSRPGEVSERRWNEDRLKAFQESVEKRAVWLYQRFHDELGFREWTMKREDDQFL